jgi:hypothetical protein
MEKSGVKLLNRPRHTQGCRVDRRRRIARVWMDQVEEDLKRMRITGERERERERAEDREEWSKIVEQTKTHPGL